MEPMQIVPDVFEYLKSTFGSRVGPLIILLIPEPMDAGEDDPQGSLSLYHQSSFDTG